MKKSKIYHAVHTNFTAVVIVSISREVTGIATHDLIYLPFSRMTPPVKTYQKKAPLVCVSLFIA
jgi:hypothetical protein